MKPLIALCIYLSAFLLLSACAQESGTIIAQKTLEQPKVELPVYPDVVQPEQPEIPVYPTVNQPEIVWITEDGGQSQLDFNPRVDILFVTDNSDSMKSAQANLIKNLNRFTNGITNNKMIDYHIGVISTWDSSERFATKKKDTYQIGELRNVKSIAGTDSKERFVTKKDSAGVLANTLKIGVAPYAEGGPEVEEFFSPLAAALDKSGHAAVNEGFFREDAQLVVIFMTDADDSSTRITPEQMAQTLIDFKGGRQDKVSVYGVLVNAKDPDSVKDWDLRVHPKYHPECFTGQKNNGKCTGFGPERLEEMIVAANSGAGNPKQIREQYIMSITSPIFGTELGRMGDSITVKTLEKQIFLSQIPRVDDAGKLMLRVRYGTADVLAQGKGQLIPNKANGGWTYNPSSNSVKLSGNVKYEYKEGARFAVDLVPVPLAN
ncbi:hypothetical protein DOM22_10370 [Bdellovibrio sp. ZAP7]|uniref:vWA domain-containing protein n=1 Tax=Bdellovibrio sp. ZAP7 TaxID=2231053 RepID=UPI00115B7082|nr:vWA domain-containing protein [Bdellovibrio sp. ZAP7]QDK45526.1 hypothetical protein DOM22_10370 [Bdellovibrio sp. ZAP7]